MFSAPQAWADVTAQDVWGDWKTYLEGAGYAVSASEAQSGDTLTVSDISIATDIPDSDVSLAVTMPTLSLVENGDGSVNLSFPAASSISFETSNTDEPTVGEITLRTDGAPVVVSGDPDDMTYSYSTDLFEMVLSSLTTDGETIPSDVLSASVTLLGFSSDTHMKLGETRGYEQTYDISSASYAFSFKDPENAQSSMNMQGDLTNLKFAGTSILPLEFDPANLKEMLVSGTVFDGVFSFGSGSTLLSGLDNGNEFEVKSASQGGRADFAMNAEELKYDLVQNESELSIFASDIPFPISLSAAEIGMKLQTPPTVSEEDRDMALGITLRDFSIPEELWALGDPGGILSHEPASIIVDLTAKGRLLLDIFDPEVAAQAELDEEIPAEVSSVKINELLVRAAGAELTGTGSFDIDYNDLESFDGMPAPVGIANLSLIGANGLLDNLIKMGLISESDATGARLGMGLLTVPGDGEDNLKSEIEFGEGGKIIANGQRIK
ncbi:DUF2125 domain-containing protein [Epibacterium sp. SM1979]|uniref:DUF2125 domain-containing protein n=1 Tax=Tritonibacter litoralis TaxID=2662264 RepID=A0A843YHA3_9RHOB|nr:DUF2125 domain-containing protein [Tritonibacter litoralis]MQQ08147.1 DUF2125 domain-containing protein [Tritonibacter litoralis]